MMNGIVIDYMLVCPIYIDNEVEHVLMTEKSSFHLLQS